MEDQMKVEDLGVDVDGRTFVVYIGEADCQEGWTAQGMLQEERENYGEEVTLLYKEESYQIMGACFAVYKEKGCGFLEAVCQECLEIELEARGIAFVSQPELGLVYRGRALRQTYQPDFICFDGIIVELKATSSLSAENRAQLVNYLKATKMELGLLVNFGHYPKLEYERIVCQQHRYAPTSQNE